MKHPSVYIIVVHYNQINDTIECIESLLNQNYVNQTIVFVDNESLDYGAMKVKLQFPQVIRLHNKENLGFSGGYNTGIQYALQTKADYIFIVNNDTVLAPDVVEILLKAFNCENIGIVSPIIYYYDMPNQIWSAGGNVNPLILEMTDNHGRNKVFTDITQRDFLSGCAMMFKREVLEIVGLFDNDFFSYYEDYDISIRIKKAGFKQLLVPQAKMWHKVSQTSGGEDNPTERYLMARNSIYFFQKHAKLWQLPIIIPYRIGSTIRTLFRLLRHKQFASARSFVLGLVDGLRQAKRADKTTLGMD